MSNPLVKITDAALDAVSHTRTTAGKVFNGATHIAGTGFQVARRVAVSTISEGAGVLDRRGRGQPPRPGHCADARTTREPQPHLIRLLLGLGLR